MCTFDDPLCLQLLQLSNFYILAVPTEMTTMSGRRVRAAVKAAIDAKTGRTDATVVIAGLSNAYADYTTTFEEFQAQRYEGGSTIYGPHQLQAYTQIAVQLATAIATNTSVPAGTQPPDYSDKVRLEGRCLRSGSFMLRCALLMERGLLIFEIVTGVMCWLCAGGQVQSWPSQ